MKRVYKERRLYYSQACERCGKRFQSFKRKRIKDGLCRKCRKINPNQESLFGVDFAQGESKTINNIIEIVEVDVPVNSSSAVIECPESPSDKHEYDPEDNMCMYCGKVQV